MEWWEGRRFSIRENSQGIDCSLSGKGSLKENMLRMAESPFLKSFTLAGKKEVMCYSFLDKALKSIRPVTIESIHKFNVEMSVEFCLVDPEILRMDTTVVETNIHWPGDPLLLWDTYKHVARSLRRAREIAPKSVPRRFHTKKVKKLHLFITRYSSSKNGMRKRRIEFQMKVLIHRVKEAVRKPGKFFRENKGASERGLVVIVEKLRGYLPVMKKIVDVFETFHIE